MEDLSELSLALHRTYAIGISEILDPDRSVERQQVIAIFLDLFGHRRRVQIDGANMRKSMAGDFVAAAVQPDNRVGLDSVPVTGPFSPQPAGDIEGCPRAVLAEHSGADGGSTFRRVVKGEAHHRALVS